MKIPIYCECVSIFLKVQEGGGREGGGKYNVEMEGYVHLHIQVLFLILAFSNLVLGVGVLHLKSIV